MSDSEKYDLIAIGGGPAGYAGAIRAGQLGKKVACIEAERAGGTCLNWGCIPSKALLKAAELYQSIKHSDDFGISSSNVDFNFSKVIERSRKVSDQMGSGIEFLFKKNKVDYFVGCGQITNPGTIEIKDGEHTGKILNAENILISTGCKARTLPDVKVDGERVMTSREALVMKKLPESIVIIGAGAIGVEFAYFLNSFGCKVRLVEMLPRIIAVEDEEVSKILSRSFKKQGIEVSVSTSVENISVEKNSVKLDLVKNGKTESIEAESILLAIGVVANTNGLLSDKIKLETEKGFIIVNDRYETNIDGIFAAGDIIGPPWLAHVATYEALQAVNGIFNQSEPKRVKEFPGCTYCQPQIASVGLTEAQVKESGIPYRVGKFPFMASGKAVAVNHKDGFVKVLIGEQYGEILGAHIIGSNATELIAEYVLAMNTEITAEEIHHTIHAHPTMSEALAEACGAAYNKAIHI